VIYERRIREFYNNLSEEFHKILREKKEEKKEEKKDK
jgi:hypothetical protein